MKQKRFFALLLSVVLAASAIPTGVLAAEQTGAGEGVTKNSDVSLEGYSLKWSDEFDGNSLNREAWNVELHEKGWVNSELQEYVDSEDNISVSDGLLHIKPVKTVTTVEDTSVAGNLLLNADFANGMDGWTETIANWGGEYVTDASRSIGDESITYEIKNPGTADWHIQLKQSGLQLEAGKTYKVTYNVESDVDRQIKSGVMSTSYAWYGGSDPEIKAGSQEISFEFTMEADDSAADFYISLGQCGDTPAGTITISKISLVDLSATTVDANQSAEKQKVTYTSGRINTQNKETYTYGLFECRAKVPEGQGYLPAFWLMANDENVYGQWPRCGEIDCMEVMGQDTTKAYGTIHYGNPHSESQGTYVLTDDSTYSSDFHTYTCEWEPGKITWYIDGVKYHEESDWYSTTEGQGTLSYPAPFDQPFYIILNLAVGGSWVGNPNESTSFENQEFAVDYVRVYQKDSYDENVTRPEKAPVTLRDADENGNYIINGDFAVAEDLTDDEAWKFLTALEGVGSAEIKNNEIAIKTENEGTVDYSIQLVQPGLPLVKGATYQVQFDAYASEARNIGVDMKAPDHGYKTYMPSQTAALTTEKQTYTYEFTMKDDTDANGRLEYNMGAKGSTADIHISNVSVKKIADADPNAVEKKTVLSNGNYIYNGGFDQGDKKIGDWDITLKGIPAVKVTDFADGRRLKAELSANESMTLEQTDLTFSSGNQYTFSMDLQSSKDGVCEVNIGGVDYTLPLTGDNTKHTEAFTVSSETEFTNNTLTIKFKGANTVYVDNIKLMESALIKNGSFTDGLTGYEVYVDSSAAASYVVDSLSEDNALDVTVNNTSDQDWKIQVKQNNVPLEQGKTYKLKFDAKSTLDRSIRVIMQGVEARGWAVYSNDNIVALTNEYQTFEDTFTMNEETDLNAFLSICLGNVTEEIITQHRVLIDNISLVEVETAEVPSTDDKKDDANTGNTETEDKQEPSEDNTETVTPGENDNNNTPDTDNEPEKEPEQEPEKQPEQNPEEDQKPSIEEVPTTPVGPADITPPPADVIEKVESTIDKIVNTVVSIIPQPVIKTITKVANTVSKIVGKIKLFGR